MTREEAAAKLEALALPVGSYVVHGSGALLLRGLIDRARDLDVLARGEAWRAACTMAVPEHGLHDLVVRPEPAVEIWGGWLGEDVDALIDGAERVDGWPCVDLRALLAFKERLDRPQDREHVALLRTLVRTEDVADAASRRNGGRSRRKRR
jgi:hypothetical protein